MNLNKPKSSAGLSATRRTHRKPFGAEILNGGVRHVPDVGFVLPDVVEAFRKEGLLEGQGDISTVQFAIAAHEFLARSGSMLVLPQLDDLFAEPDQVNVPATSLENPNWRRKYRVALEEMASSDDAWHRVGRLPELRKSYGRGNHAT
jgi:4-alpha-glucanotransferase